MFLGLPDLSPEEVRTSFVEDVMSIIGGGRLGVYRYVLAIFIPGYMSSNIDDTLLLIRVVNCQFFHIYPERVEVN